MKQTTLESLEKRVVAIEKSLQQLLRAQDETVSWKDWRKAIGRYKATELTEEIDAAGRKIREADRRKAAS